MRAATGKNGRISFDGTIITITRTVSLGTFLNQGVQGERYILARTVTAMEFRDAAKRGVGFISFDYPGKKPPRGGILDAMADEAAVLFTGRQAAEFAAIRDAVLAALVGDAAPPSATQALQGGTSRLVARRP